MIKNKRKIIKNNKNKKDRKNKKKVKLTERTNEKVNITKKVNKGGVKLVKETNTGKNLDCVFDTSSCFSSFLFVDPGGRQNIKKK